MASFKGQGSFELMITLGVVLAFTVPVLLLLLSITSVGYENTAKAQADAAARSLADSANFVYSQGPGVKKELLLNVPSATEEISLGSNGEVIVRIRTSAGAFEAVYPSFAEIAVSDSIEGKTGLFKIILQTNDAGQVEMIDPTTN